MKKYIVAQFIFLHFVMFQSNAMNPFVRLPLEVCDYIMTFLVWESKDAFVERTKINKALSACWSQYKYKNKYNCGSLVEQFRILCPDETKMAIVDVWYYDKVRATLTIAEKTENGEKNIYNGLLAYRLYQAIALSQSGDMIATIQKQERSLDEIVHYHKNIVVIQRLITPKVQEKKAPAKPVKKLQEIKKFILPDGYDPTSIAFNKQGTHIVVHGTKCNGIQVCCKTYGVLRLESDHDNYFAYNNVISCENKKNNLEDYFRCHRICKSIT